MSAKMPAGSTEGGEFSTPAPLDIHLQQMGPAQIPVPSVNTGKCAAAEETVKKVLIRLKETLVATSKIGSSKATPGLGSKGLMSSTKGKSVEFKGGFSPKVYACGKKVVHLLTQSSHNDKNAPVGMGSQKSQSDVEVAM